MPEERVNLLSMDRGAMQIFFTDIGEKEFRARQVLKWVYQREVSDFSQMTDLSKSLRTRLSEIAVVTYPEILADTVALDGTRKWLLRLADGNCIETVYIPEADRGTLCISSQVGCALNCTFCATARQGFNRNLSTAEIIGQLCVAQQHLGRAAPGEPRRITNVVMMGMGEPLLNFDPVVAAMRLMLDDLSFGLSKRRVTLSTAGVIPAIDRLSEECPVSLAVSLHAPTNALRERLVPLNRKYPIEPLIDACRRYVSRDSRRRVTFEYTMLDEVNDSEDHAKQLARLLRDVPAKVNLIPFNPSPGISYRRSPLAVIDRFRQVLLDEGIMTITRRPRGEDIEAACGQLAGQFLDRTHRSRKWPTQGVRVN